MCLLPRVLRRSACYGVYSQGSLFRLAATQVCLPVRLRGLSGSLSQTEQGLLVDDLRVGIDDVRLTGSISVGRKIRFSLQGNRLDLDRYIEALADNSSTAPTGGFPGKTLLGLPLEGTVRLDSAVSGGLRMREITLEVTDRSR